MIDRWKNVIGLCAIGSAPFLTGADGNGCTPGPRLGDAGPDSAAPCVSVTGGVCGGDVRSPCTCSSGLECRAATGGPAEGGIIGTCQPADDSAGGPTDAACVQNVLCIQGDVFDRTLCRCVPGSDAEAMTDGLAGPNGDTTACTGVQGARCGGNTAHPCACGNGLVCTPDVGGPPFGDVGGTCEPLANSGTPGDGGCVQTVLCLQGDRFDRTLCRCVPANEGGLGCQSVSDCHGILPQLCRSCPASAEAGPSVRCAHWECRAGQCETVLCN